MNSSRQSEGDLFRIISSNYELKPHSTTGIVTKRKAKVTSLSSVVHKNGGVLGSS